MVGEIGEKLKEKKYKMGLTKIYEIHMKSCQAIKNKQK